MIKLILYCIILTSFAFSNLFAKLYKFEYQKEIDVGFSAELELTNRAGKTTITGSENGRITIRAEKYINAEDQTEAERLSEYIKVDSHRKGDLLSLSTRHIIPPDKSKSFWDVLLGKKQELFGSVDFVIGVPSDCKIFLENRKGDINISQISKRIRISSITGNIRLDKIVGNCDIKANTGEIVISDFIGDLIITTYSSNIDLSDIRGVIDIESTTGNKRLDNINGNTSIEQTSGAISVTGYNNNIRIKSSSGKIDLDQISGGLNILGNRSDVTVRSRLDNQEDYFIETSSGNIRFSIPEGLSGSALMKSNGGDINTDFELLVKTLTKTKVEGSFGIGQGPRIFLMSGSGDITLESF